MKEPIVADSTCLIGLERIGRLDVLPALFEVVIIPPEVAREFGGSFLWLQTENLASRTLVSLLKMVVDAGEAEAIALASEKGFGIIADDKQARTVAEHLGLKVIGTLGVLIRAKRHGLLASLRPVLKDLEENDFYISDALREEALRLVKE